MQRRYQHRPATLQAQRRPIINWTSTLQFRDGVQRRDLPGRLRQPPLHNSEERSQGIINWTRTHRPPPRVSNGGHASPSGIPSTPWRHQRDAYLKFQEGHQVATDWRGRYHVRHNSRRPRGRPIDRVHHGRHQRALPTRRQGHGSPHITGGPRHHIPVGEGGERYNAPLPPNKSK